MLSEPRGGGDGITNGGRKVLDQRDFQLRDFRAMLARDRAPWARIHAKLGHTRGLGSTDPGFNYVRGRDHAQDFGLKGVAYSPGCGRFWIKESGTYEFFLHHINHNSGSAVYLQRNQISLVYTYANNLSGGRADSANVLSLNLEKGDSLGIQVASGNFHANAVGHVQMWLRKIE